MLCRDDSQGQDPYPPDTYPLREHQTKTREGRVHIVEMWENHRGKESLIPFHFRNHKRQKNVTDPQLMVI